MDIGVFDWELQDALNREYCASLFLHCNLLKIIQLYEMTITIRKYWLKKKKILYIPWSCGQSKQFPNLYPSHLTLLLSKSILIASLICAAARSNTMKAYTTPQESSEMSHLL